MCPWWLVVCAVACVAGAGATQCPRQCTCIPLQASLQLICSSDYSGPALRAYLRQHAATTSVQFSRSGLRAVPPELCELSLLASLDLSHNSLQALPARAFSCHSGLQRLNLDHNNLSDVHHKAFQALHSLADLSIQYNLLDKVDPRTFTLTDLADLTLLNLAFNQLYEGDMWPFRMKAVQLMKNVHVNFTFNAIQRLVNTINFTIAEVNLSQSLVLDFRNNQLKHIAHVDLYHLIRMKNILNLLNLWNCGFYFHFNPFDCDCDMYKVIHLLKPLVKFFKNMQDRTLLQVTCKSPLEAKDRLIIEIPDEAFSCQVVERCPAGCSCTHHPGINFTKVNCTRAPNLEELPLTLPQAAKLSLSLAGTGMWRLCARPYLANVTQLDVSGARLEIVELGALAMLSSSVHSLRLHTNQLHTLPQDMAALRFDHLEELTLWGNPWDCDCFLVWLRQWLLARMDVVSNLDQTMCGTGRHSSQPLTKVPHSAYMCGPDLPLLVATIIATNCLLIVTGLGCKLWSTYRDVLRVRLLRVFKSRPAKVPEEGAGAQYPLDVAIVYEDNKDSKDDVLACHLEAAILSLRGARSVRLVARDTESGHGEASGAEELLESARTVVLVMCRHFVQDPLCCWQFNSVLESYVQDSHKVVVAVLVEERQQLARQAACTSPLMAHFLNLFTTIDFSPDVHTLAGRLRDVLPSATSPI